MDQQGSYTTLTGGFGKLSSVQLSAISYGYRLQLSAQLSGRSGRSRVPSGCHHE